MSHSWDTAFANCIYHTVRTLLLGLHMSHSWDVAFADCICHTVGTLPLPIAYVTQLGPYLCRLHMSHRVSGIGLKALMTAAESMHYGHSTHKVCRSAAVQHEGLTVRQNFLNTSWLGYTWYDLPFVLSWSAATSQRQRGGRLTCHVLASQDLLPLLLQGMGSRVIAVSSPAASLPHRSICMLCIV